MHTLLELSGEGGLTVDQTASVLVTGASGRVGRRLVEQLAAAGVPVRAAGRTVDSLTLPAGVDKARLDLSNPDSVSQALDGVDSAFLYAVPAGIDRFLEAAQAAGLRRIVLLSSHTLFEVEQMPARAPIAQMHETVEDAIVASGIEWTFLRPANFASNILMWGWADSIRAEGVVRFPYPESYSDAIHEADIASSAAAVLTQPGHAGQAYFISGPEPISQREQAETIEAVLGRPVRIEELSPDEAREHLRKLLPEWVIEPTMAWWEGTDGEPCEVTNLVKDLTGTPARSFHQWTVDNIHEFR